ncbi:YqjK family protein [Vreelandella salicampi]|uniref:YqjK-like family protein n=1 Tax=Vreelandella salicampi TaxID=1449798 RepID=A0A7Z0RUY9_9GAMM|nr:YqjK family protein [Halomonas salicampi]NYS60999.1 YqjK-like family protein [Halomonas salicampi]
MPSPMKDTDTKVLSRAERKRELLNRLEQQRIDMMVESLRLQRAGAPLDASWQQVTRFKTPLTLLGGIVVWKVLRQPGRLVYIGKRALTGYVALKKLRRLTH